MRVGWQRKALRKLDDEASFIAADDLIAAGRVPGTREPVVSNTRYRIPYRVSGETIDVLRAFHILHRRPSRPCGLRACAVLIAARHFRCGGRACAFGGWPTIGSSGSTTRMQVDTIECGSASGALRVDNAGIGTAVFSGLMMPANFLALGVLSMRAGIERGATGLLYRNDAAAICCDPVSMTAAYPTLAPALRALPVAFVINAAQAELYAHVVQRAAAQGLLRRSFSNEVDAREWLGRAVQAVSGNRHWWAARRDALAAKPGL